MMSNYPPGVTGNEWQIAGMPECGRNGCGHAYEVHDPVYEDGPCETAACSCDAYTPYPEGPDPDDEYDRWRDSQWDRR